MAIEKVKPNSMALPDIDEEATNRVVQEYKGKVIVRSDKKVTIHGIDTTLELWREFRAQWVSENLENVLRGNRQAVLQKFTLFESFISQEHRTDQVFARLAKNLGFSSDGIQDLHLDFSYFMGLFTNWVRTRVMMGLEQNGKKADNNEDFTF